MAALGNAVEEATSSKAGPSAGWADAMAKVLNKKIPQNKSTILAKNKKLEKEREKEKQERLEKRMKVRKTCSISLCGHSQMGIHARSPQQGFGRVFWDCLSFGISPPQLSWVASDFLLSRQWCCWDFSLTVFSGPSGRLIFGSRTIWSVSLRWFCCWECESSCFKLSFLIAIVNLGYNALCRRYKLK